MEPKNVTQDEVAFWLYSSGSTGKPKGVKHVHGSLKKTFDTYANQVLGIKNNDIVFSVAKLFFAYGLGNAMTFPMSVGATTILLPTRPVPEKVSEILKKYKITMTGIEFKHNAVKITFKDYKHATKFRLIYEKTPEIF